MVGVSALFPGSTDRQGFWQDILAGRDLVTDVPATHWLIDDYYDPDPQARDKTYARRGAFLPDVDFDPVAWGIPPTILPTTDTTQLLALIVAQQVLHDACGGQFDRVDRSRVSVILGVTSAQELLGSMVSRLQRPVWVKALREMGLPESQVTDACERIASHYVEWKESTFPGVLGNVVAGRIANRLNLGGTNCITDAACASSFSALGMAVSELRLGQSDLVITGGADTMNDIFMYICFSKTPALSPSGDCRPFSDRADGTLLGEGIGMVALKRLADAERDGDRVYAVIKGVGSSSDGRSKSVYAPVSAGQAVALRRAYGQAGFTADTVELIEAHGTGTKAGDAAEFEGLRMVFDESGRGDRGWCALGSVKSQVGHTKAAAGAAGLFKAVMALHHKVLPPTIKVDKPDPKLGIEATPFYLNTAARPWVRADDHPRRAGVSSFGFGGSNFHIAVEEYTGNARAARDVPHAGQLLLLSGATCEALAQRCTQLADEADAFIDGAGARDRHAQTALLAWLGFETQTTFDANAHVRVAVFVSSPDELAAQCRKAAALVDQNRTISVPGIDCGVGPREGALAWLFPGQGSQFVGMGGDVVMAFPQAQAAWDAWASAELRLPSSAGARAERLDRVVFPAPAFDDDGRRVQQQRLTDTRCAQPALGVTSLAYLNLLRTLAVKPDALGGHSFGEVTALHAAGVLAAEAFFEVARQRGEAMADAANTAKTPGAMLSVSASIDDVRAHLARHTSGNVVVANHNSPRQVVVSGAASAIDELARQLQAEGVATTRLDVATAFHSPMVAAAREPFAAAMQDLPFALPNAAVFANATAAPYPHDAAAMKALLADQLTSPVRFVEQIEAMYANGVRTFVEVGPGHVLSSLVGHILKDRPHRAVALGRKGRNGVASFWQGLGALAAAGVPQDFAALWACFATPADPRSKNRPALTVKVNGAGYGKPYPPPAGASALPKPNPEPVAPVVAAAPAPAPAAAAAPTQPAPVAAVDSALQYAWVMAIVESQRQTAEAHAAFQRAMAESHTAFLRAAESSLMGLASALGGPAVAPRPLLAASAPTFAPAPQLTMPPAWSPPFAQPMFPQPFAAAAAPAYVAPAQAYPQHAPVAAPLPAATYLPPTPPVAAAAPVAAPAPAAAAPLAAPPAAPPPAHPAQANGHPQALTLEGLQAMMLNVVAARTGYPEEMLGLDMDLEADLGVDSIKRVEILSAVMERAPGLPEVNTAKMASMRTLREIVDHMGKEGGLRGGATHTNGASRAHTNGATEGVHRPLVQETS